MSRLFAVLALAGLALLASTSTAHADSTVTLDHVRVHPGAGSVQVVTVNHTHGSHARVTFWRRRHGRWDRELRSDHGRIGYGGLVAARHRHQGTGTTPLGTVRLIGSFGTHRVHGDWDLPYRHIRKGDYWVEDNGSAYYNRYRDRSQGGFRWWLSPSAENGSERLRDYPHQYEYAVETSYNYDHPVRHRGAGIFLHVNGSGATAGCVSVPRWFMRDLMGRLNPIRHPVMAIGR